MDIFGFVGLLYVVFVTDTTETVPPFEFNLE